MDPYFRESGCAQCFPLSDFPRVTSIPTTRVRFPLHCDCKRGVRTGSCRLLPCPWAQSSSSCPQSTTPPQQCAGCWVVPESREVFEEGAAGGLQEPGPLKPLGEESGGWFLL